MKKLILFILLISAGIGQAQNKMISLNDIWKNYYFYPNSVSGFNFLNDGKHYTKIDRSPQGMIIMEYDLSSGDSTQRIFSETQLGSTFSNYFFSEDEQKLLIETNSESIYRHSTRADFLVYDRNSKKINPLSEDGKQRYASFNPKADKVAFVRKNNLYYKDLQSGKEIQITKDGKTNEIINGATDWVYEEEFGFAKAFQWSPDGTKIAFYRFNEAKVKEFSMTLYTGGLYPEYTSFKYPKAGEDNAVVDIYIYDLNSKKTVKANTGSETDIYFPRINWRPDNMLVIYKMNRHQNKLELLLTKPNTGATSTLLKEKNPYYVDIHDNLTFLKNGNFIWTSEENGFNHIYLYNASGSSKKALTKGKFDVTNFYGVDEKNGLVFFQSSEESPLERHLYSVDLKGKKKKRLSKEKGTHNARFSKTFDYFVHNYSTINRARSFDVCDRNGNSTRIIEDNQSFHNRIEPFGFSKTEFFKFKTSENVELNGWMIKPPNFDANKEYPVFMYVYGGPGSQTVRDRWDVSNGAWFQMLAQQGYIVVSVDNRGTGARGQEFKKMTYLELGKYETIDQIEAAKYLGSLPYINAQRIGIFGWSYGGYLSSLCLLKGSDVFKMAIAVAPVTNWKWYDTIYTERYMKTPSENENGYEDNSPVNFAGRLEGHYLLVHGNADDNVHFQNSAEMANALIKANKQFDTYYYPNRNHGIYGDNARLHLFTKMTDFILENL